MAPLPLVCLPPRRLPLPMSPYPAGFSGLHLALFKGWEVLKQQKPPDPPRALPRRPQLQSLAPARPRPCCPQAEPKRLRKELPKALKMLRVDDRVLLLGTSDRPYVADAKALCKAYERVLLVPRPDYTSRYGERGPSPSPLSPLPVAAGAQGHHCPALVV